MDQPQGLKAVTLPPGSGYGDAGCEYIAGLVTLGVPVTWTPIFWKGRWWLRKKFLRKNLRRDIQNQVIGSRRRRIDYDSFLLIMPPAGQHLYWNRKERKARLFTLVTWEGDHLPKDWAPALNRYDGVFVPCEFNHKTFLEGGVTTKVDVVPHIARAVQPVHEGLSFGDISEEDFVFYTIGAWITRKAMEETVRAYLDTFSGGEKVALIVKTETIDRIDFHNMSDSERKRAPAHLGTTAWTLANIIAKYQNPAKVHLIVEQLPLREIDHLHTRGDCFLSLTRSEGWGLGAFDAANFGNPVIITGWGGQLDYLGADYPYLVDYELEPTSLGPDDGGTLPAMETKWARADQAHASQLMRSVFEDRKAARDVAGRLQPVLAKRYASETVSRRLAELMGFRVGAGRL